MAKLDQIKEGIKKNLIPYSLLGIEVFIRPIGFDELLTLEKSDNNSDPKQSYPNRVIYTCLIDSEGEPVFTPETIGVLPIPVFATVVKDVFAANGLGQAGEEAAKKN